MVVVESASDESLVMEDAMIIAILLAIAALVFMCWLLFTLAIYALPLFVGLSAAFWAHSTGAGLLGAVLIGFGAGIGTLVLGQLLFATVRTPIIRLAIALLFAVPAAVAGFHAVHGIVGIGSSSQIWRNVLGSVGAVVVGATAWMRLAGSPLATGGHFGEAADRSDQTIATPG